MNCLPKDKMQFKSLLVHEVILAFSITMSVRSQYAYTISTAVFVFILFDQNEKIASLTCYAAPQTRH